MSPRSFTLTNQPSNLILSGCNLGKILGDNARTCEREAHDEVMEYVIIFLRGENVLRFFLL